MQVPIISIGNSRGLRLSKALLEQYQIRDQVELILEKGYIIIKPVSTPRQGWDEAFKAMREAGDDQLLMDDVWGDESFEEWS